MRTEHCFGFLSGMHENGIVVLHSSGTHENGFTALHSFGTQENSNIVLHSSSTHENGALICIHLVYIRKWKRCFAFIWNAYENGNMVFAFIWCAYENGIVVLNSSDIHMKMETLFCIHLVCI